MIADLLREKLLNCLSNCEASLRECEATGKEAMCSERYDSCCIECERIHSNLV